MIDGSWRLGGEMTPFSRLMEEQCLCHPGLPAQASWLSAVWMVILSIIPPDVLRIGVLLVGGVICLCNVAYAMRPQVLMEKLQFQLLTLEGKLRDTVDSGIIHHSDTNFTAQIERNMGR